MKHSLTAWRTIRWSGLLKMPGSILADEHAAVQVIHSVNVRTTHNGLIIRQITAVKYVGRQAALLFELVRRCSSGDVVS